MWVFTNIGFISAVKHRNKPGKLMVRARAKHHLRQLFPQHKIRTTPDGDYRYRVTVSRKCFKDMLREVVDSLEYDNFKGSIHGDPDYAALCTKVWTCHNRYQEEVLHGHTDPQGRYGSYWPRRAVE